MQVLRPRYSPVPSSLTDKEKLPPWVQFLLPAPHFDCTGPPAVVSMITEPAGSLLVSQSAVLGYLVAVASPGSVRSVLYVIFSLPHWDGHDFQALECVNQCAV